MKRKVIDELIRWKTEDKGKPILLTGAKGVGKTYLAYDFAKAFFDGIFYMNLEREPKAVALFQAGENGTGKAKVDKTEAGEAVTGGAAEVLARHFGIDLESPIEGRVLILDEIGCSAGLLKLIKTEGLSSLFRFIICISSRPISREYSSCFREQPVYPLEFDEFLLATGNEWYVESIVTHFQLDRKIPEIVHKELLALHQLYLQIGGMPAMVNEYLNLLATANITEQHNFLIGSYHDSVMREHSDSDALKMNQVYDSIPFQLMKENKKFQYKLIRKGTTHAMYKDAIRSLLMERLIMKCSRVSSRQLEDPVKTFRSESWDDIELNTNFKLYLSDTGLLHTKISEENGDSLSGHGKKALLENYVAQALQAKGYPFAFWESDGVAKIDFLFLKDQTLFPVEIFEAGHTRSKSISILKQGCDFPYSIKVSTKNFDFSNGVKYVPHYAVFCL
ncbi:MAG TPA: ATP-binding protein [Clostridiales bacterium]|nr:ATP-binding protein [Clostridiales bacterium]